MAKLLAQRNHFAPPEIEDIFEVSYNELDWTEFDEDNPFMMFWTKASIKYKI